MDNLSRRARSEWRWHQMAAWIMYAALVVATLFICAFGLRFVRPQAMIPAFSGFSILEVVVFVYADRLVNRMMSCAPARGDDWVRLEASFARILPATGLRRMPRIMVSEMDMPNAFAYGNGLLRPYSIAVTRPLLSILDDDELDAILGHEIGHIRSRDVWAMTLISATLGLAGIVIDKFAHLGKASWLVAVGIGALRYVPRIIAAAISQLREFAADAFSAAVTGNPDALIRSFDKLRDAQPNRADRALKVSTPLDELLMSHPNMEMRKHFLNQLKEKP